MSSELIKALKENQEKFGITLSDAQFAGLGEYYKIVMENNDLLHLVAPCTAETFATRHILESLMLLEYLPQNASFADVGTGAGLPSIPCMIVRDDLKAILIESSLKKGSYLSEVIAKLDLAKRAELINKQFEEIPPKKVDFVVSRALDKFTQKLPKIFKWAPKASFIFFGGNNLEESLKELNLSYKKKLLPEKDNSFIYSIPKLPNIRA